MLAKRNLSIDILKIALAFLIVGLHGRIFKDFSIFLAYFFQNGISRAGVPLFLIISGYYFYSIKTKEQFANWVKRLLYLYLIWMGIYLILWRDFSVQNILFRTIFGYYHLWYLINALYGFLFAWAIRNFKLKTQLVLIALCVIIGLSLQYIFNYGLVAYKIPFLPEPEYVNIFRNGLFFCFPFIMTGYLINKFAWHTKKVNWLLLIAVGFSVLTCEVVFNYNHGKKLFDLLLGLYIFCPALFVYVLNLKFYGESKTIALYSSGIYLVHILVLNILAKIVKTVSTSALSETPTTIITFLLAMLATYFLIRIQKKFKYIL